MFPLAITVMMVNFLALLCYNKASNTDTVAILNIIWLLEFALPTVACMNFWSSKDASCLEAKTN